ncbi:uncharacterized protein LOC110822800 [Carica papaya]|uniref:uncharacterized protein LOC110822800 n=1 Tax=Carica papaya TaxID=3649 RepID=UPI000B8C9EA5|nr:uncharacterized protein LOC110822800 [Carica papaya]
MTMEISPDVYSQDDHHHEIAPPEITFQSSSDVNHPLKTESLTNLLKDASREHQEDRYNGAETEELSSEVELNTGEESRTTVLSQGGTRLDNEPVRIENGDGGGRESGSMLPEDNGRERLKRHRIEVAGSVWIPEIWGQEKLLKDWIDCSTFDASLVPGGILSARAALVEEGRRANSGRLRIENRC